MQEVLTVSQQIDTLADALRFIPVDEGTIELIYGAICGDPAIRAGLLELIRGLQSNPPDLQLDNPVCDNQILNDLVRWGLNAAEQVLSATTHQELCR